MSDIKPREYVFEFDELGTLPNGHKFQERLLYTTLAKSEEDAIAGAKDLVRLRGEEHGYKLEEANLTLVQILCNDVV